MIPRNHQTAILIPIALVFGLFAATASISEPSKDHERGAALLAPFKADLQRALRDGLAKGGVEAVGACRIRAPEIADDLTSDGVRVGRSSHRLRNPANAPPAWVKPILDDFVADPSNRAPTSRSLPDERVGYAEPITTQPMCLTCHGDVLEADLAARIASLYPEDRAVGFEAGDLRGVFWVEFPRND